MDSLRWISRKESEEASPRCWWVQWVTGNRVQLHDAMVQYLQRCLAKGGVEEREVWPLELPFAMWGEAKALMGEVLGGLQFATTPTADILQVVTRLSARCIGTTTTGRDEYANVLAYLNEVSVRALCGSKVSYASAAPQVPSIIKELLAQEDAPPSFVALNEAIPDKTQITATLLKTDRALLIACIRHVLSLGSQKFITSVRGAIVEAGPNTAAVFQDTLGEQDAKPAKPSKRERTEEEEGEKGEENGDANEQKEEKKRSTQPKKKRVKK